MTCRKCQGRRLWHVRTMREAEGELGVSLREEGQERVVRRPPVVRYEYPRIEQNGRFETYICATCGYTEWYARDFKPHGFQAKSNRRACPECERHEVWCVDSVGERTIPGSPKKIEPLPVVRKGFPKYWSEGHFSLEICHGCGHTLWLAQGMSGARPSSWYGLRATERPCPMCGADGGFHVDQVHEQAGELQVSSTQSGFFARPIGSFSIDLCTSCGVTDWFAHGLEKLYVNPHAGVSLIERPDVASQGPYR